MTVPPGVEQAQGISSMYVNTLWKGVKRWRQTLLHGAQWQSIRCYVHIESLPNHKKTHFLCVYMAGQPLEQVFQRCCGASVCRCSKLSFTWSCAVQFGLFCFDLRSLLGPGGGQVWTLWIRFPEAVPSNVSDYVKLRAKGFTFFQYSVFQLLQLQIRWWKISVHSYVLWVSAENRQHQLQLNLGLSRVFFNLAFSPLWVSQFKLGEDKCVSVVFIQMIHPQKTVPKSSFYR